MSSQSAAGINIHAIVLLVLAWILIPAALWLLISKA